MVWSHTEPDGSLYPDMIAPHPELILEELGPMSDRHEWLEYPPPKTAPAWSRRALHLEGRLTGR